MNYLQGKVNVTFYSAENYIPLVKWIPNKHYSGVYGLLKLIFPEILTSNVTKIITLDTDITILANIKELWSLFEKFNNKQAIGLVENQSDWYFGKLWNNYKPWPAIGRGFNTGVMLLNIDKLKNVGWSTLWHQITKQNLENLYATSLADQDIINAIIKEQSELVYQIPCYWNVQLSDNSISDQCYLTETDIKAIHWNSPTKTKLNNKYPLYFQNLYQTFQEYNGNLLRHTLFKCNNLELSEQLPIEKQCSEFRKLHGKEWRTHLYFMDFDYVADNSDVTLVTQLSIDRLHAVEELSKHWEGPMSLTIYLSDSEALVLLNYVTSSSILKFRKNIAYHIVYKEEEFYPINFLRNVGLKNVNTPYVYVTDIDFLPMYGLYTVLKRYIQYFKSEYNKKVFIIPAFETQKYRTIFPKTKSELIYMLNQSTLFTFRYDVWAIGHNATNYTKWKSHSEPYKVNWIPNFEPYIVAPRDIPLYDTRFVGFGWNKVSHIMELNAQGYSFIVLPNTFMIHMPHAPSLDIVKFRTSVRYRLCLRIFKEEFIDDLNTKYSFVYNNSLDAFG